ncbi:MAG: peptide chain release factor N(5)-glutamine methyltransferase [Bacteroidetes bacterium]|nr:MAG: peptide chain release factor N(5)-glutamine methyltransferase [Bacteroidota bacterium]
MQRGGLFLDSRIRGNDGERTVYRITETCPELTLSTLTLSTSANDPEGRPWTRRRLLEAGTAALQRRRIEPARRQAAWMLAEVLGCTHAQLLAYGEQPVPEAAVAVFEAMLTRRLRGEPLQYILGHTDFFGLRLRVTPAVLIPRPETEQVVEAALEAVEGVARPRILDVGTGSGCIALALKHARPEAAVWACDVSPEALALAAENAATLELEVTVLAADVLAPDVVDRVPADLDLLISNPPYIPDAEAVTLEREVRDYEPALALFSGDDPLRFYRRLVAVAPRLLRPGGWLVLETHADFGEAVAALARTALDEVQVRRDLAGRHRIVVARQPGSGGG